MFRGLGDIAQLLLTALPPWALAALAGVLVVVAGPAWFDTVRIKQIKGCIRRMLRAPPNEHAALIEEAFDRAGTRPARLAALVREAHKYGFKGMAERGLQALAGTRRAPADVHALERLLHPPPDAPSTALQAVVRVEQLIAEGLWVGAKEQLEVARKRYPNDADLEMLERRLAERGTP